MKVFPCDRQDQIEAQVARHADPEVRALTAGRPRQDMRERVWDFALPFLGEIRSVLCLGARDDSEIRFFEEKGLRALGLDVATSTGRIRRMDAHDLLEWRDGGWDVIFASHSLEHLHDVRSVLLQIREVARIGLIAVLPLRHRRPSLDHTTIFDVMLNTAQTPGKDFEQLEPYEHVARIWPRSEVALAFRWTGD